MEHSEELTAVRRLVKAARRYAKYKALYYETDHGKECAQFLDKADKWEERLIQVASQFPFSPNDRLRLVARVEVGDDADTPAAPQPAQGEECQHGHLARKCIHCELIASEARVAELEAELKNIIEAKRTDRKFFSDDTEFASWAQNRCYFTLNRVLSPTAAPGKEAKDADE